MITEIIVTTIIGCSIVFSCKSHPEEKESIDVGSIILMKISQDSMKELILERSKNYTGPRYIEYMDNGSKCVLDTKDKQIHVVKNLSAFKILINKYGNIPNLISIRQFNKMFPDIYTNNKEYVWKDPKQLKLQETIREVS